ncbi:MAG: DUF349 domain-containing protein [Chitinophagales bacterium]|nr:DUF349 domain-containing protein [Chitinophagales bacterium]
MTKREVIEKLEALLRNEDMDLIAAELEGLETDFQKATEELEQQQREAFEASAEEGTEFAPQKDQDDARYKELLNIYNDRREKFEKQQELDQQETLRIKQEVIEELKRLIKEEDRIAQAFDSFKALQEKWRNAGSNIPQKLYKQLQSEYSHQLDMFFYTIDIYRALKIHDFNKNLDIKKGLIESMRQLKEERSIRKMEALVKTYQNEWAETGPVPEDQWKEIRDEFRKATNEVYELIQSHYDNLKEQYSKALEGKRAIIDKLKELAEKGADSHKLWQEASEEVLKLQKEYKESAPVARKDQERIFKEFRAAADEFFAKKKAYYDARKEVLGAQRDKKMDIIKRAEELKDSTDWKKTTDELIALQNEWKESGSAGQRDDQKLWNRFRAACNHFFDAKKLHFSTLDDRLTQAQQQKEALIARIEAFAPTGDSTADMNTLKEFSNEWKELGHVPRKEADRINELYKTTLDKAYDALRSNKTEKAGVHYKNKLESLQQSGDNRMLDNERRFVRDQIKKLEDTIDQYETNLGFFGRSKGADALKADIQKKIDQSREELKGWQQKLKMLQQTSK